MLGKNIISLKELPIFVKQFSSYLRLGDCILLSGELGAGKTTFVKALLDIFHFQDVSSPSFSLINQYQTISYLFFHLDLYRLNDESEFIGIDLDRYLCDTSAIKLIEWPERLGSFCPLAHIQLSIEYVDEQCRKFILGVSDTFDASRFS